MSTPTGPGTYRVTVGAGKRLKPKDFARAIADLKAFGGQYDSESRTWTVVYDGESAFWLVVERYDLLTERLGD